LLKKLYLHKLAYDLKSYEYGAINKMDGILTLSIKDSEELANWNVSVPVKTVPVAILAAPHKSNPCENTNFFHLGSMNWQPNIEAVQLLIKIFAKIKKELPEAELHIAGSNNQDSAKAPNENGIFQDGYVPDLSEYCKKIGILVSPIQSGSGIRIKILEMMALGIPVITTDIGAQGIDYKTSDCIVIANTETEIVQACIELATDDNKRSEIALNGMNYIRKNHNIDTISKEIIEFIRNK
jgi:glycosyltransferase involved in cell wall biosynthesis